MYFATTIQTESTLGSNISEYLKQIGVIPFVVNLDRATSLNAVVAVKIGSGAENLVEAVDQAGEYMKIPLISTPVSSDN